MNEKKDYYQNLGLDKNATKEDIKTAYRRLAMKLHPDRNKNDPKTESEFKAVKEAYEVLINDDKRKQYDNFGSTSQKPGRGFYSNPDVDDIFSSIFEGAFTDGGVHFKEKRGGYENFRAGVIHQKVTVPVNVMISGGEVTANIMSAQSNGKFSHQYMWSTPKKILIRPHTPVGHVEIIKFGSGMQTKVTLIAGNIPGFKVSGCNIITEKNVNVFDILLGKQITITHVDGKIIKLKIPQEVQPGGSIRLARRGLVSIENKIGDLIIKPNIVIPTLNDKQKKILNDAIEKIRES